MLPTAESIIVLRVSRQRKAAYVRAALSTPTGPTTLAAWCFAELDRAAKYVPPLRKDSTPAETRP